MQNPDGTEICHECKQIVKIGDCYGHGRNCSELCNKCKRPAPTPMPGHGHGPSAEELITQANEDMFTTVSVGLILILAVIIAVLFCACGTVENTSADINSANDINSNNQMDQLTYAATDIHITDIAIHNHGDIYSIEQDDMSSGYNPCVVPRTDPCIHV